MTVAQEVEATEPTGWAALFVLLGGALLPQIDFFIVNVTLPSIKATLGTSNSEMQLVISGYASGYALFLIAGGRMGDLFGRRRMFLWGMAAFTATSAICGLAPSGAMLVIGRVLQGIAAAVMTPQTLGSIRALYAGRRLGRALSPYGASVGLAAVWGQLLGGVLVTISPLGLGWRSIFLINLPVGGGVAAAAGRRGPESRARIDPRFDFAGAILLALGLFCLVYPLSEGREHGWPPWSFMMTATAPVLLALFLWYERRLIRRGGTPLADLTLFSFARFARGCLVALLFFTTAAFYFLFSVYQQAGLDTDAFGTSLAIVPYGIGLFLGPLASGPLTRRLPVALLGIGLAIETLGYAAVMMCVNWLVGGWPLALSLFIAGTGQGIAVPRLVDAVVSSVPSSDAGLAAGILSSTLQVGAALSAAAIGSLFFAVLGQESAPEAYGRALGAALAALLACLSVALLLSIRMWSAGPVTGGAPQRPLP